MPGAVFLSIIAAGTLNLNAMKTIGLLALLPVALLAAGCAKDYEIIYPQDEDDRPSRSGEHLFRPAGPRRTDLSVDGTANCYVVGAPGDYSFNAGVRGNGKTPVGDLSGATVEELWSTFNSAVAPRPGELITDLGISDGAVTFTVPDPMTDGNVVVAVRGGGGEILWSWHLWLLQGYSPEASAHKYNHDAGIMMDRNLGALSASVGDPRSVGFLYQWGRKDPFPSAVSFSERKATPYSASVPWPDYLKAGSIETAVRNPMRFMGADIAHQDWYVFDSFDDPLAEGRWSREKTEFDPCPPGWRVPDGGASGVWAAAFGRGRSFSAENYWQTGRYGYDFRGMLADVGEAVWYPTTAYLNAGFGTLSGQGQYAMYWACTTYGWNEEFGRMDERANQFYFYTNASIQPSQSYVRAQGCAVRCLKEGTYYGVPLKGLGIGAEGCKEMNVTIGVGEKRRLPLVFRPENASNKTLIAVSDDASFVQADSFGCVTGVRATYGPVLVRFISIDGDHEVWCNVSVAKN